MNVLLFKTFRILVITTFAASGIYGALTMLQTLNNSGPRDGAIPSSGSINRSHAQPSTTRTP